MGPVFRRVGRRGLSVLDLESRWHLQAAVGFVGFVGFFACGRSGPLAVLLAPAEVRGGDTVPMSRPPRVIFLSFPLSLVRALSIVLIFSKNQF